MSVSRTCVRRPVAVAMLVLAVALLGGISYSRLPINLLPDVSFPRLVVHTAYPDVAPAEVERLVTELVEAQAAAVPGVEHVRSISQEGASLVTLRFAWGTDMDFATLNVRERLDNIRDVLPETSERPNILRVDPQSEPILAISVARADGENASSQTEEDDLLRNKEIAETIFRRRLEQLDGVAQATVTGGLDREIQVAVDPVLLETYGVTQAEVSTALKQANHSSPGGTVLQGRYRYPLRTLGEFQTVDEIRHVVVARKGGRSGGAAASRPLAASQPPAGEEELAPYHLVRLSDVAEVVDGFAERETIARYNGRESVGVLVYKEPGANTVAVSEEIQATLAVLAEQYPEFSVEIASNQAQFISDSISNVVQALVLGGILAFVVLFFFLRDPRYPVAVSLAIPVSVIGTFALMDAFGVSLNIMSLGGLALGVGMLVDNSIIVLENIFRHRQAGAGLLEAAAKGAEEVQGAITASTLTTISVFGPIIYVEGVAGELFSSLSLAVAFSLLASLLVALTLLPTMAGNLREVRARRPPVKMVAAEAPRGAWRRVAAALAWLLRAPFRLAALVGSVLRQLIAFWTDLVGGILRTAFSPLFRAFDRAFGAFAAWYHDLLARALDHRARVLGVAGSALAGALLLASTLKTDLLPDVDQGAFSIRVDLPEGASLQTTAAAVAELERTLLAESSVDAVFSRVGRDVQAGGGQEEATGVNTAVLQVRLDERAKTESVLERVRSATTGFPEGALSFETGQATALGQMLGGSEADIAVRLLSEDLESAYGFAEEVERRLAGGLSEIRNVRIGSERGQPQYQVSIDREAAARYEIDARVVADVISTSMRGDLATNFVDFDRKIAVMVRLPDTLRYDPATLDVLRVNGVPLRELVEVRETVGPAEIRREEQGRVVTVYADVASGGLGAAISAVEGSLAELQPPAGVRLEVGGENEEMRRSFRDLTFAFGLALLLVYMILAAQFESFFHPFTILTAVPLALVGAILALALAGQGMNTMSLIGVVILVGIVVNDAIVKVDFINQARGRGVAMRDAILEAGEVRLRPIVMTTVTTVLGLAPMALGLGRGADLRAPMAVAVIGGLIVATALTLVVVPVTYAVVEDLRNLLPGRRRTPVSNGLAPTGDAVT